MIYFQLFPKDTKFNHWLFHVDDEDGKLITRREYEMIRCNNCGKLDEFAALAAYVPEDVVVNSHWDFVGFSDDFGIAVSRHFVDMIHDHDIKGLAFIPLPGDPRYSLLLPKVFMAIDPALAGFEYPGGKCGSCGRPKEAIIGPLITSVEKPDDPMTIFTGTEHNESFRGRRLSLFCTEPGAQILRKSKISGLEIVEAL
jgi:hypothetical protein